MGEKKEKSTKKKVFTQEKKKNDKKEDSKPKEYDLEQLQEKIDKLKEVEEPNKKIKKKLRQLEHLQKRITQELITRESCALEEVPEEPEEEEEQEEVSLEAQKEALIKDIILKSVKRFVVFVGNLPKTVSEESIMRHFKKVGSIKSVRIPPVKGDRKNGFAFLELQDRISYEKTLSMHHTMFENKRINVLYTNPDGKNIDKKEVNKKNAKLNALRKAGKLEGSIPEHQKRSFRRKKKRLAEAAAAMK